MEIYKLKYADKETAIADLLDKKVYIKQTIDEEEFLSFGEGIHAIVEIGKICLNEPTQEIIPIFADGYHYDVMSEQEIDFKENEIVVNNPKHGFLGH
jgi:hypothetical protein